MFDFLKKNDEKENLNEEINHLKNRLDECCLEDISDRLVALEDEFNVKDGDIYNPQEQLKNYNQLNERLAEVEKNLSKNDERLNGLVNSFKTIDEKLTILVDLENSKNKEKDVEEKSKVKSFKDYTIEELIPVSARVKYKSDFDVLPNGFLKAIGKGAGRFSLNIFDVLEIKEVFGNVRLTPELVDDYSKKYFKLNHMNVKKILYNFLMGKFDYVLDKWEKMNDISNMNIDYVKSIENDDVYINNNGTNVSVYIANSWKANYNNSNNPRNYLINLQKRNRNMSFCVLKCICEKWVIHEEKKDVKVVNNVERRKEMGLS